MVDLVYVFHEYFVDFCETERKKCCFGKKKEARLDWVVDEQPINEVVLSRDTDRVEKRVQYDL
jgi:hypothetical protein